MPQSKDAFWIYINTFFQGPVPVERGEHGKPVVYATREEAEREIAEYCIQRLQQYLEGERDFDDAITVEEYVVPVTAFPDGSILDNGGKVFSNENW